MKTFYVSKKCELTLIKSAFEQAGFRCYRVRTNCSCTGRDNSRNGILVIDGEIVRLEVVRCKACAKSLSER